MTGQGTSGRTRERDHVGGMTGRIASGARGQPSASTLVDTVMRLQRDAGNLAVTHALATPRHRMGHPSLFPLQRQPAATVGAPSSRAQLGAVWDAQVVIPTARAADRLARAEADPKGARTDLETALRTILTVSTATPAGDPDRLRLQIIERRTRGVLDLVDQRFGGGKSDDRLVNDMIDKRSEAAALGPALQHMPDIHGMAMPGSLDESAATATAIPSGAASPGAAGGSIADAWDLFVVNALWSGQQALVDSPGSAITHFAWATYRILEFIQATPTGHTNRLRLLTLHAGIQSLRDRLARLDPALAGDPLVERATDAYEAVVAMGEILTGEQSSSAAVGPDSAQGAGSSSEAPDTTEPDFTWERERPPMQDDTALERP